MIYRKQFLEFKITRIKSYLRSSLGLELLSSLMCTTFYSLLLSSLWQNTDVLPLHMFSVCL